MIDMNRSPIASMNCKETNFYKIINLIKSHTNGTRSNVSGCLRITTVPIMTAGCTRYNENPIRSTMIHNKLIGMFIVDVKFANLAFPRR